MFKQNATMEKLVVTTPDLHEAVIDGESHCSDSDGCLFWKIVCDGF